MAKNFAHPQISKKDLPIITRKLRACYCPNMTRWSTSPRWPSSHLRRRKLTAPRSSAKREDLAPQKPWKIVSIQICPIMQKACAKNVIVSMAEMLAPLLVNIQTACATPEASATTVTAIGTTSSSETKESSSKNSRRSPHYRKIWALIELIYK